MANDYNKNTRQITLTRGDSFVREVTLKTEDGSVLDIGDSGLIQFGVKEDPEDDACLIKKTYRTNPFILNLEPDDTKGLESGKYCYDAQVVFENGYTETFTDRIDDGKVIKAVFKIAPEVV